MKIIAHQIIKCVLVLIAIAGTADQALAADQGKLKDFYLPHYGMYHLITNHMSTAEFKILINPGLPSLTVLYYQDVGNYLNLPLIKSGSPPSINTQYTLDNLIQFCGFQDAQGHGLTAVQLDSLPGTILNDVSKLNPQLTNFAPVLQPDEMMVGSFFAPKICNVGSITGSNGAPTTPPTYGYRKAVLLQPRANSPAKIRNITGVWVLFNYFVLPGDIQVADLILTNSVNTQVMLTFDTKQQTPTTGPNKSNTDAAYFLDFNATTNGAKLNDALNATFDSGDPALPNGAQNYYVPDACAQCHGQNNSTAALNLMDTDHWFERVRTNAPAGTDFAPIATCPNGVLLDGGKDFTSPTFTNTFQTFLKLNQKIAAQNNMSGARLQPASVQHWLDAHANNNLQPLTLSQRSLGSSNTWTVADEPLLSHFDRYCYRCHNAIIYNVFNKAQVIQRKSEIPDYLTAAWAAGNPDDAMPQDRQLDPSVITTFTNLLQQVQ
jgi:hypothetical protein